MRLNKKGITLLEVVLAITILSIVLISFLTLFPQVAKFNAKTDEKLSGMYLANEKIGILNEIVKSDSDIFGFESNGEDITINKPSKTYPSYAPLNLSKDVEQNDEFIIFYTDDGKIQSKIEITRKPDNPGEYYQLYKIYVEVQNTEQNEVSSIYGYLSIPNKDKE